MRAIFHYPLRGHLGLGSVSQGLLCSFLSPPLVFPSLGLTILEVACNMELPHGGEGWQQLRQGYLPPEFTAGEWGSRDDDLYLWQGVAPHRATIKLWVWSGLCPRVLDMTLPHEQVFLLSCVLSLS